MDCNNGFGLVIMVIGSFGFFVVVKVIRKYLDKK